MYVSRLPQLQLRDIYIYIAPGGSRISFDSAANSPTGISLTREYGISLRDRGSGIYLYIILDMYIYTRIYAVYVA